MIAERLSVTGRVVAVVSVGAVYGFLLLPLVVVTLVSFSPNAMFSIPSDGISLRWYEKLLTLTSFWRSFGNSIFVALVSSTIALVAATAACFALAFYRPSWSRAAITLTTAPLMFPGLVLGIALLQYFSVIGVRSPAVALLLGHSIITLPFFIRALLPAFANYDFGIYQAALCLGASPLKAVIKAVLPVVAPGVVGGFLFAFFASFENYTVSLFLTDVRFKTVPIQMLQYIEESADPSVAAISVVLIVKTIVLLLIVDWLFGIRRV